MNEKEDMVNIGLWFKRVREQNHMEILDLSEASGVSIGTISRSENDINQITLNTAYRLCLGLNLSVSDVLLGLRGRGLKTTPGNNNGISIGGTSLQVYDLHKYGEFFLKDNKKGTEFIIELLNSLLDKHVPDTAPYTVGEIDHILERAEKIPWQTIEITWPQMSANDILNIYKNDGVITRDDLINFLEDLNFIINKPDYIWKAGETVVATAVAKSSSNSMNELTSFIYKNRTKTEGWAIKLDDVLTLDDFLAKKGVIKGGELLALWWKNEEYNQEFYRPFIEEGLKSINRSYSLGAKTWDYKTARITLLFLTIFRWLQSFNDEDHFLERIKSILSERKNE